MVQSILNIILIIIVVAVALLLLFGVVIIWGVCKGFENREDPEVLKKWKEQSSQQMGEKHS